MNTPVLKNNYKGTANMTRKNDECLPIDYIQSDAGFHRSTYHIVVPRRFSFADTLDPSWWKHQTRIKDNDIIDLVGEAGDFDCTCRVVSADRGFVILRVLREWFASSEPQQSNLVGEAHVALVPNFGWTLFGADAAPIARFGDENSARKALADLPAPAEIAA